MFKTSPAVLAGACVLGVISSPVLAVEGDLQGPDPRVVYADQPASSPVPIRVAYNDRMGGGFVEFLFGGGGAGPAPGYEPAPRYELMPARRGQQMMLPAEQEPAYRQREQAYEPARPGFDPKYEKQMVEYSGRESAGTIVIDTPSKFLYLVQGNGKALRYGIGVGKPGFTWSGVKQISAKKEWPDWTPPSEMLKRRPDLPRHMEGGPENPLGARAMYLGSTLYRIHGSNEPWTIGTSVSSGCIRMRNEDVIDLYGRVNVGTRVIVI
jgi:lipoprotein-anchoring transpeptidase ErfK/SrfK